MKLSKDDFEWLRDNVEKHLTTTYHMQYKVATPQSWNNTIADILERTTHKGVDRTFSCGSCVYNLWNRMAQIYFQDKQEMDNQQKQEDETPRIKKIKKK